MSISDVATTTVEILKQIRDGVTNGLARVEGEIVGMRSDFNSRFERLEAEAHKTNERLERVESGLNDLGKPMRALALEQTEYKTFHTHHVEILEKDMEDLRARMLRLEARSG